MFALGGPLSAAAPLGRDNDTNTAQMSGKTGEQIAGLILDFCEENNLDISMCREQGYDNASNMKGDIKGAQARIKEVNKRALYSPCGTHSLNLAGAHSVKSSVEMKSFFGNVEKLYMLLHSLARRWEVLKELANVSLHALSDTRWSARLDSLRPLVKRPREICDVLIALIEDQTMPPETVAEAEGLLNYMRSFEFVVISTFWLLGYGVRR